MNKKTRHPIVAIAINKMYRLYWFITRPKTRGVKVLIFNSKNEILMVRLTYYPNTWTFIGGGVDKNEKPDDAIIRECKEEIGIDLKEVGFITTLEFNYEYKKDTLFVYKALVSEFNLTIDKIDKNEIAEVGWFSLDKLPIMGKNAKRILEAVI